MVDIAHSTAVELAQRIQKQEISSREVTQVFLDRITHTDGDIHAFLHVNAEQALQAADRVDQALVNKEKPTSPLYGVPIALKDIFTTVDAPTTCGSQFLEGWISPYDATVTSKLRSAGLPILGKTNLDEFAMGSSTENSAFGPTFNPWDTTRTAGGSGGGSAAALAAAQAPIAVGTDTGGSIRQPAALTGTVGTKPTYGTVSRYGLVACASSLDQGGPCGKTVLDTAYLHQILAGYDENDSTSSNRAIPDVVQATLQGTQEDLRGLKIGVVKQLKVPEPANDVTTSFNESVKILEQLGAEIVEVSCPNFEYAIAAYYLILPTEVSSNLARFDAMRYGRRVGDDSTHSADQVMAISRAAGFGAETKRRIMLGTFALSAEEYTGLYGKAAQIRNLIRQDFAHAFQQTDVLISPTTPTTAFPIGEKVNDPLTMYLFDLYTIPTNLAGNCAINVPSGIGATQGLPVGLQIMAPDFCDDRLYRVGAAFEQARGALSFPQNY